MVRLRVKVTVTLKVTVTVTLAVDVTVTVEVTVSVTVRREFEGLWSGSRRRGTDTCSFGRTGERGGIRSMPLLTISWEVRVRVRVRKL